MDFIRFLVGDMSYESWDEHKTAFMITGAVLGYKFSIHVSLSSYKKCIWAKLNVTAVKNLYT